MKDQTTKEAKLRVSQRLLISAADTDPGLLTDHNWQASMIGIQMMLAKTKPRPKVKLIRALAKAVNS